MLRSLFTPITEPLGMLWLGLLALVVWHASRREWRLAILPAVLSALMFGIGSTKWTAQLLATLERPYAGLNLMDVPSADAVVMLGGTMRRSANDPFKFDLAESADRVVTAAHLARLGKGQALVLGGGGPRPGEAGLPEGELVKAWLDEWNVVRTPILLLGACVSTRDEAERCQALMEDRGWHRIILVTSAAHMRRAEGVFRELGIPATAVACDFQGLAALSAKPPFTPFPRLDGFEHLQLFLHEQIGWWVYRSRGWVE
jgi:uncharacterized SAM-binding protein YcdF (DUF218 family)